MYTYKLFEINNGYGYNILWDENIFIHQEYEPDTDGYVVMTKELAEEKAKIIIKRIVGD